MNSAFDYYLAEHKISNSLDASTHYPQTKSMLTTQMLTLPQKALAILRRQSEFIYALLDAARDSNILLLLKNSGEEYQSLYEGAQGEELADVAPYLVGLPAQCSLLETLLTSGWNQSWGVFLISNADFKAVRRHFRHFLLVEDENGKELYFRFYDSRVLRVFLPTCKSKEAQQFFGPVNCFLMEDEHTKRFWRFTCTEAGVEKKIINLDIIPG